MPPYLLDMYRPTPASFSCVPTIVSPGLCAATSSSTCRSGGAYGNWQYITNPHLPPRATPDFRSREDLREQVWTYSFKDNTGRVLARTSTQRQMDEGLAGGAELGGRRLDITCPVLAGEPRRPELE
jgi:hypothetical protein